MSSIVVVVVVVTVLVSDPFEMHFPPTLAPLQYRSSDDGVD
jgi:hypothetical protein